MPRAPRTELLAWVGAGALAGALLAPALGSWGLWLAVVGLGAATSLLLVGVRVRGRPRAWLGPAGLVLAATATAAPPPSGPPATGPVEIRGEVLATGRRGEIRPREIRGAPADLEVVRLSLGPPVAVGDEVRLRATLAPAQGFRNASPHPAWPVLGRVGLARDAVLLARAPGAGPRAWLGMLRGRIAARLDETLEPSAAALARALVLGDTSGVDPEDAEATRRAGLSHVVAVSGMHVTLVVGAAVVVLGVALRRWSWLAMRVDVRRLAWGIGAALAPLYAELAGGSPSAWRAAATASIGWSLAAAGRRASPLALTGLVVVLGWLVAPGAVCSPAFVLSVVATAAVLDPAPQDGAPDELAQRLSSLRAVARASVRAAVATAPFTLWCFGTWPLPGILANLVVVPLVAALLLPVATAHAALASVSEGLGRVTALPTELLARAFLVLSERFAELGGPAALPPPDSAQLLAVGVGAAALLHARRPPHVLAVLGLLTTALAAGEAHLRWREAPTGTLRATFVDVGQGDAALLDMPDGSLWLVDAGGASFGSRADPGERALLPLLRARRRRRIDVAVVTHPHPDHMGGLGALLRGVPVGEIWDSGQATEESPDSAWASVLRGWLAPRRGPGELCGPARSRAGARVEVLWPCPAFDPGWDANENSLVLRVTHGTRTLLLLGDAEQHTERSLAPIVGRVDVVKVGHHGSRTSSTPELLAATRPWLAVVSAGPGNRYGHPHAEVLQRWAHAADHLARTDLDGSVTVWTDGRALRFETWSGRSAEAPRR